MEKCIKLPKRVISIDRLYITNYPICPMSATNHIAKLDLQLQQLRSERALLLAEEKSEQRRRRNRKCFVVGAYILAKSPELVAAIGRQQTRKHDRALFDLPPLKEGTDASLNALEVDIYLPIDGEVLPAEIQAPSLLLRPR